MQSLAVGGYTARQIEDVLLSKGGGREIAFRFDLLDKNDGIIGELDQCAGSVAHNAFAEIKGTSRFSVKRNITDDINWYSERIQPYMRLKMPGGWVEWSLGVYLANAPAKQSSGKSNVYEIEGYDKAQVLKEDKILARTTIAAGTNYVNAIVQTLNSAGIIKTNITPSAAVTVSPVEFEPYTPKLEVVNTLLAALNYTSISFDAYGYAVAKPYVEPSDRAVDYEYRTGEYSIIKPGIQRGIDMFNLPNVFVRYVSNPDRVLRSTYTLDDAANPLSTISRGRHIVDPQEVKDIADQTTLDAYTRRAAIDGSRVFEDFTFATTLMPHHTDMDCLYLYHKDFSSDVVIETGWSMDLKAGGDMTHNARKVVRYA